MTEWFQTWDRPEYLEWAKKIVEGYLLHIIRRENGKHLVVKAKLIMGEEGLPAFEVLEQCKIISLEDALKKLDLWKAE